MISRRGLFRILAVVALSTPLRPLLRIAEVTGFAPGATEALRTYYYGSAAFLANLKANTPLLALLTDRPLPEFKGGKMIHFVSYKITVPGENRDS